MTAVVIPAEVLRDLRRRRGLVELHDEICLTCSRSFRSAGPHHRICNRCKIAGGIKPWEFAR
jgi:hypothetical protein